MFVVPGMVFTAFAQARMGVVLMEIGIVALVGKRLGGLGRRAFLEKMHLDAGGVRLAQGQRVTAHLDFDGIPHRGALDHLDPRAGSQSHTEEMRAGRAFSTHTQDNGLTAQFQTIDRHTQTRFMEALQNYSIPGSVSITRNGDYSCVAKRCSARASYFVPGRPQLA